MKAITKTVWVLSFVSFFTDIASEMLYPVMPLFLSHIGYSAIFIGLLEGLAEAVAGLTKGYFGRQSDLVGRRLPFVQIGYALSAISKPIMAFFIHPLWIFSARTLDRLGKGVRTGARDGLLSDESQPATRARVFGFHRSMDTLGAVLGPTIALVYLYYNPNNYQVLFLLAFAPGLISLCLTFIIKEKKRIGLPLVRDKRGFAFGSYWRKSPQAYKKIVSGFLLFALFNSSDVFLLLRMKEAGFSDTIVIGIYIFYNLVFALLAYPIGLLADKVGLKKIYILGLIIFALVYTGFSITDNAYVFVLLFVLYGFYAAATEGISKAWISNVVDNENIATAIGTYSGYQSIAAMIASSVCGLLWYSFGSAAAFLVTAIIAIIVAFYLSRIRYTMP